MSTEDIRTQCFADGIKGWQDFKIATAAEVSRRECSWPLSTQGSYGGHSGLIELEHPRATRNFPAAFGTIVSRSLNCQYTTSGTCPDLSPELLRLLVTLSPEPYGPYRWLATVLPLTSPDVCSWHMSGIPAC